MDGLAHSAGSAGDQLNPAGLSVQVLGTRGMGNPCGLQFHMSRSGLTVPGRLVTTPFFYIRRASPWVCRHARASSYTLKHEEKQRKDRGLPICLGNTRKYPGEEGEGRTPLSMARTALKADVVQKSVSWEFKGRDERPLHGSYHCCKRHKCIVRLIGSVGTRFHGWLGKCEDSSVLSHVGWNDVHGLGRTDHDRDSYDMGRFIGFRLSESLSWDLS
ncbi:hypothetical protein F2Q68_00033373 [Brassica cretica]|nr:hypothetical protein F2Q68_00033373 [Brassica cretica]